jgi:hypothetical protein
MIHLMLDSNFVSLAFFKPISSSISHEYKTDLAALWPHSKSTRRDRAQLISMVIFSLFQNSKLEICILEYLSIWGTASNLLFCFKMWSTRA